MRAATLGPSYGAVRTLRGLELAEAGSAVEGPVALTDSEEALRASEERYRDLFENAFEPMATVTMDECITEVNAAFERVLGYSRTELIGSSLGDYLTPASREISARQTELKMSGEVAGTTFEHEFIAKDGRSVILEVSSRVIMDDGRPIGIQGSCRDITARKEAELEVRRLSDQNQYLAVHDGLTGLPNRGYFRERIEHAIAADDDAGFAVVLIDLDRFKEINDTLGHHYGDLLLVELAKRLSATVRQSDTVARLSGDEFGMLLPQLGHCSTALDSALERILKTLEQPFVIDGLPLYVEASMGVALFPADGSNTNGILQHADIAMYAAKNAGLTYMLYSAGIDHHDPGNLALLSEIPRALAEGELVLHYQPNLDTKTGELTSVEALIRWQHPTRGLIPPGDFIPLVERTGLIQPLTRFVLDEALAQIKRWECDGHELAVAVNLSKRNLHQSTLPDEVAQLLDKWELSGERLTLEITESAIASDPGHTAKVIERLRANGMKVSIDDFGVGYTSLGHLARLDVDQLKIDRSFVLKMRADKNYAAIVRSIITLGHDLGLEVVAEGVETGATRAELVLLGCDKLQGYHVGRPLPPDELARQLVAGSGTPSRRTTGLAAVPAAS